jgi:hypothetical protein
MGRRSARLHDGTYIDRAVLHQCHMGETITVHLPKDLAVWLKRTAAETGVSQGRIVRAELEQARKRRPGRVFMRLAGSVNGSKSLSSRKGFSRS